MSAGGPNVRPGGAAPGGPAGPAAAASASTGTPAEGRRVAVLGAGDMGGRHASHWAAAGAQVVVVADADAERAAALAEAYGAEASGDPTEAAARVDVDVVSVCLPTFLHAGVTVAALEGGADVLSEKPVALTLRDAEAMGAAARATGRTVRIGFMRRFDPLWRRVEQDAAHLGTPVMAQATLAAGVRPKLLMHDAYANGGPVIDMACHLFDRWERVFGTPPLRVRASGHTFAAGKAEVAAIEHVALDTVQVDLDYGEAGSAQLQLSWGLPAGVPATERHAYVGPEGVLDVDEDGATLRQGPDATTYAASDVDPWREEIFAFARELAGDGPQGVADLAAGVRALRASLAVLEAVRTGGAVDPAMLQPEAEVA